MKKNGEHFVTCGQMKLLERRADENGLSYYEMMEAAGNGAAAVIMERAAYWRASKEENKGAYEESGKVAEPTGQHIEIKAVEAAVSAEKRTKVYLFCGKGNNGGDGFVVARRMHDDGYEVTVILVDGEPRTEDAHINYELLKERNIKILDMVNNDRALMELKETPDIIVDAIYGTGFKGKLKSNGLKSAIYINRYSRGDYRVRAKEPVLVASLDIPSGMGGDLIDKRELDTNCITADFTITFHAKKPVHVQKFAAEYCGDIYVADIGIDEEKLWSIEIE